MFIGEESKTQLSVAHFALLFAIAFRWFPLLCTRKKHMAEIVGLLSPLFKVLFEKLLSGEFSDLFRGRKLNEDLLRNLKMTLISANKLVEDAEDKALVEPPVKEWLDELKDAVYDAGDILDEIATKALRRKLDAEVKRTASKVRNSTSDYLKPFAKKVEPKIKQVLCRLKDLIGQKDDLGLKEVGGRKLSERRFTTSLVEESDTFGRDGDKEKIINLLLSDDTSGNEKMIIIPIVGLGGMGKTTLAQLVYNDKRVKEHFDLKAWVCVSEEFDVASVTKTILEEVGSPTNDGFENLNELQLTLQEKLIEKKFLVVLDDLWNESLDKWELLNKPFKSGAQGSVMIITTRNERVASRVRTVPIHHLNKLSGKDCWLLFAKHAFDEKNFDKRPELEVIGRELVKKCDGLPLAIKVIGHVLRFNSEVDEWEKILESNLWDLSLAQTDIHPCLRLSFKYLSPNLKLCFAYLSIFPKSHYFGRDFTIDLWKAQGLLKETANKTKEEVGHDCFATLTSMSLLEKKSDKEGFFTMHHLVNDLAKSVSGQFTNRLMGVSSHGITNKTRHLSFMGKNLIYLKKFEIPHTIRKLHTLILLRFEASNIYVTNAMLHDLFPMMTNLRALSLNSCKNVTELPKSIGKMKYLYYLNLEATGIIKLPDSICKLCNLQVLILAFCGGLIALPKDMHRLVNLRVLDIWQSGIKEMPTMLGQLKQLQRLTKFFISKDGGACIQTLGNLANLGGFLSIFDLQNVVSPVDALEARLKEKKNLKRLHFRWNSLHISESQRFVLNNLMAHTNLESLAIENYCAESLPNWVGHSSFSNITYIWLKDCKYCYSLPPLGQLCSLQKLIVVGLEGIVKIDGEFYGNDSLSIKPFGALQFLWFENMLNWEQWSFFGTRSNGGAFPQLKELYIKCCPKLIGGLPAHLPSLAKLEIFKCPQLVASLTRATTIQDLQLVYCNEALLKELPARLQRLRIGRFDSLEYLHEVLINCSSSLQEFSIGYCMNLELSTQIKLSSLETLELWSCDSLTSVSLDLFPKLHSLNILHCKNLSSLTISKSNGEDLVMRKIDILDCPKFVSFPKGGLRAPMLTSLSIKNCRSLGSLPDKMNMLLPSLKSFCISYCPEVTSFPDGGLPCNVEEIRVWCCEKFFATRLEWGLAELLSVTYLSITAKSEGVMSFPDSGLLPSSLLGLQIGEFQNMKSLDKEGLQHLTSLRRLLLINCPNLVHIPGKELPSSLSAILINGCSLLKKQLQRKKAKEQAKIRDDVDLLIDGEYIG